MEKKWYLDRIDILKELSEEDRAFLTKNAIKKYYEKGCCIFSSGDPGNRIFLIQEGVVKIYDLAESGKESIFWFRYQGEFFGLAEAFGGEDRMCFAEAVEPTSIFVIRREVFEELLKRNPKIALIVIKILAARMRRLGEALKALHFQDLRGRLAQLLLSLGDVCGVEMGGKIMIERKFTHQELADMIGATRQRVTEALNNLVKDGLIQCDGKKVMLLDQKRLSMIIQPSH
ncbi:MAG: Crp/Fnr family transcriptional regulator [Nitrospirae bacterium]|nr:Crp/Fnr family transcriptional regulator [Nitrospirota bacterium]MCL5422345.1 Crp/Fnr family transcriptional regulator [Nitrospirota bacterium]